MTGFLLVIFSIVGCDEDFSSIGGEIIDNPTNVELREVEVNAYSAKINSIQTNNLQDYLLGVNNHPVYGQSTASILTQVSLSQPDPEFGNNVQLDSVVLKIPYFSTQLAPETGDTTVEYELDSVFGNAPFKLSIFENNFVLNDLDPDANFEERQRYYSDQQEAFEQNIIGEALFIDEDFEPSAEPYRDIVDGQTGGADTIIAPPALRVKLPVNFFKQKIIDQEGNDVLSSNANFTNHFRSLLIKAEAITEDGTLMLLNLANSEAKITLYYTFEEENQGETERVSERYDLNIAGNNRVNTFTGEFPEGLIQEIEAQGPENLGAENLFLKGMEGSMAVIEIFNDSTELAVLRTNNWLINEANLKFYVNQDRLNGATEPERLFLYDLTNNQVILDFTNDPTINDSNPITSRTDFSQALERDEDGNGIFYRVRVTQLINSILNDEEEPVKLGLVITTNINNASTSAVRRMDYNIDQVPAASIPTPKGTVLYGNLASDESNRLKLRIFYTDTNQ